MKGIILSIERGALNDGPGIRTVVFLKGCAMSCLWCHNPESIKPRPQLAFFKERCVDCKACNFCPNQKFTGQRSVNFPSCNACGECVKKCTYNALKIYGEEVTSDYVAGEVFKDKTYFDVSGGGLTLSGGEPLFQSGFCRDILEKTKERGIHNALETSGFAPEKTVLSVMPYVDLFLFDVKAPPSTHKALTGVDKTIIDENLDLICAAKKRVILRCPIIENVNNGVKAEAQRLKEKYPSIEKIEFLPYHNFGENKRTAIGRAPKHSG